MRAYLRVILSVTVAVPLFALVACDETIEATKAPAADSGVDAGPVTSLYQRLGKREGIAKFVDATFVEEVKDPEIAAFFAPNAQNPPPAGHPTVAQIKGCLVEQIAAGAADPSKGDPVIAYPAKLADNYQCRDMKTTHAGLGISSAVFDKFGAIAVGVAKAAGLAEADLKTVSDFLAIQKPLIVSAPVVTDGGTDSAVADTGTDAPVDAPDAG